MSYRCLANKVLPVKKSTDFFDRVGFISNMHLGLLTICTDMIQIFIKEGESIDRMIKRFGNHIKSRGLMKKARKGRYFQGKTSKIKIREAAISREGYRAAAKKRQYLG